VMHGYMAERERAHLTQRQVQLIRMAAEGMQNKQIASSLHLSLSTVRNQMYDAYERIGARNRAHAAAICWQRRLIA
jgi:DNA-binding NarL/FixJ family response regulator